MRKNSKLVLRIWNENQYNCILHKGTLWCEDLICINEFPMQGWFGLYQWIPHAGLIWFVSMNSPCRVDLVCINEFPMQGRFGYYQWIPHAGSIWLLSMNSSCRVDLVIINEFPMQRRFGYYQWIPPAESIWFKSYGIKIKHMLL